jgi:hypothetical protein
MNPIEAELLNYVEKYSRSKQVKGLQLLNQAQAARSGQPTLLQKAVDRLGDLLVDVRQRLGEWNLSPGRQRQGQAQQLCRGDGQKDAFA